jgi:hypothetical protein
MFLFLKNQTAATKKILPKDVPGTLLNMVSFVQTRTALERLCWPQRHSIPIQ